MDVKKQNLHHGGSGGAPLQVRVVGRVPIDWEGPGQNSPWGDTEAEGADETFERIWDMYITSPGDVNGGSKPAEARKLCHPFPKQCRIKYCDKANYGPMSGGVSASGRQVSKRYREK